MISDALDRAVVNGGEIVPPFEPTEELQNARLHGFRHQPIVSSSLLIRRTMRQTEGETAFQADCAA
jgi:hypothetical protein